MSAVAASAVLLALLATLVSLVYPRNAELAGLGLLLGILLIAPLALRGLRGTFDPLESIHFLLAFYGYTYVAKPLLRVVRKEPFLYGEANIEWAMTVAILGLLALYCGYYTELGVVVAGHVPTLEGQVSAVRVRVCAWIFVIVGAAGLWSYMEISGGWREFWSVPHGYGGKPEITTAYVYQLPELMVVGFFLLAHDALRERKAGLILMALAGAIGGVGIYTILWSRRTFVLWISIALFILAHLARGRAPRLRTVAGVCGLLFAVVGLVLAYRPVLHLGATAEDFAGVEVIGTSIDAVSGVGDEFDSFLAIVGLYPDRIDYDYFALYRNIPLHPIPRLMWLTI